MLLEWPPEVDIRILHDMLGFRDFLKQELCAKKWEFIPVYNSLTVINRVETIRFKVLEEKLKRWYEEATFPKEKAHCLLRLPVCYAPDFGIDLEQVSAQTGLSVEKIIEGHTSQAYTVYGLGFIPGFMYLGGLSKQLWVPRLASPRPKVIQGAVGLADRQTGVYPQETPGGWNIIGNCPIPIFNGNKEDPCLVRAGDQVQFYPISLAEYQHLQIQVDLDIFQIEKSNINA